MLQSNQVLSFFQACERGDWSQRELAEFYRVEDALTKSGVGISTDRGLTDEGEPWFVFFRQDDEEVIVHFARIGGEYVVASNFTEAVFRGRNFQTLVRELLDSHPYVLPKQHSSRSTVFLHPATLLAALVVTGYVKSSELNATADDGSRPEKSFGWFLNRHDLAATYSAIVIASVWDSLAIDTSVSKPSDDLASLDHAQPAHGEHGPDIEQAVADDSLLQNIQAFHGTDDRSVLTAAALDLDGQDAVHDVNEPAIAGLVANPSGLHPESSHHDNAAASSAHDVFRAENVSIRSWRIFARSRVTSRLPPANRLNEPSPTILSVPPPRQIRRRTILLLSMIRRRRPQRLRIRIRPSRPSRRPASRPLSMIRRRRPQRLRIRIRPSRPSRRPASRPLSIIRRRRPQRLRIRIRPSRPSRRPASRPLSMIRRRRPQRLRIRIRPSRPSRRPASRPLSMIRRRRPQRLRIRIRPSRPSRRPASRPLSMIRRRRPQRLRIRIRPSRPSRRPASQPLSMIRRRRPQRLRIRIRPSRPSRRPASRPLR